MQFRHYGLFIVTAIIIGICTNSVSAGEFYLHQDEQYWWYYNENPHFYAVVPNNAERYVEKNLFGCEFLEISWEGGSVLMEIGTLPDSKLEPALDFVAKKWAPYIQDQLVFANWEITTSNQLKTYFYAFEGSGRDNKKFMLRSVFFQQGDTVVYLAMFLPSGKYQGAIKNHWLRAVNEFEW